MPNVRQSLRLSCFIVQTSSCNFILESLWIPGTSILRYSIYRLNYESKLYQYVKILYVQPNRSMLLSALGLCTPSFLQDDYAECWSWPCRRSCFHLPYMLKASLLNRETETVVWEDLFYCVLYSYLDCRRLVKHENVPSNFQAPLCMCVCIKM